MRSDPHLKNSDEWPNLAELETFADRLPQAAASIKRDANGRVCGSCKHLREHWCTERQNVDGNNLKVHYPGAVACGQHEVRT